MNLFRASLALAFATALQAGPMTLTLQSPPPPESAGFHLGTARAPDGQTIGVDSRSLWLDGHRWIPVMGEYHFARNPAAAWPAELAKMRAGGVDVVATYVFWIHHEETAGQWDWSGDRDLAQFVRAAAAARLKVIVRVGPWCHGEVRHGGLPDWVVARGHLRSDDPAYLALVRALYEQIARQLSGLLWKDGGPVIGIQLENEYHGPAEHLLTLKRLAREAGLDVPLYTRTGWPELQSPMPFGEILPLYGVYAEGFWDRELTPMPGRYWSGFHFSGLRTDANIANELLGRRETRDSPDIARYPYLTCEIGGGMMSSYHRRIRIDPRDVEATTLVKLGSGSNGPGYYMYHGGTNPAGRLTTLMESQSTTFTNYNDLPEKNYDFQAPLGAAGQVRPHYFRLRRLHLFLHAFGESLAGMPASLPDQRPSGQDDTTTLRWAVRSDGRSGFVFLSQYERLRALADCPAARFSLKLADGTALEFPREPITIPADTIAIWPFNLALTPDFTLTWATAQPVSVANDGSEPTYYFSVTPGVAAEFCFGSALAAPFSAIAGQTVTLPLGESRIVPRIGTPVRIVVLSVEAAGRLFLPPAGPTPRARPLSFVPVRSAGPLREIKLGPGKHPVAMAPTEADFAGAATWKITIPPASHPGGSRLLRLRYLGDVARIYLRDRLVLDDFYHGEPLELDLSQCFGSTDGGELIFALLPLSRNAPILFSPTTDRPNFGLLSSVATLQSAELMEAASPPQPEPDSNR